MKILAWSHNESDLACPPGNADRPVGRKCQADAWRSQGRKSRHGFNLVEVALAMAVVGMGIAGVMALFQLGMQQSRDAVGDNYAADSAEQFITFAHQLAANGTWTFASGIQGLPGPGAKPDADGSQESTYTWSSVPNTNIMMSGTYPSGAGGEPGLYRVVQGSASGTITDFDAAVRVWQEKVKDVYFSETHSLEEIDMNYAVALHVEVSWPRAKPYDNRQKRLYYVEIFNKNATP